MTAEPTSLPSPRHLFPRTHRLSGKLAFSRVYDEKVKESRGPLVAYSRPNGLDHPRLGLSVSRRVGAAPVRNRFKRLIREAFRSHQHDLPTGYDLIIVVRPHKQMILAEYQKLMTQLMLKSHWLWTRRNST